MYSDKTKGPTRSTFDQFYSNMSMRSGDRMENAFQSEHRPNRYDLDL